MHYCSKTIREAILISIDQFTVCIRSEYVTSFKENQYKVLNILGEGKTNYEPNNLKIYTRFTMICPKDAYTSYR